MFNEKISEILATWFYLGKSPKAPGTVGTLGAIPLVFLLTSLDPLIHMLAAVLLVLLAIFVASAHEAKIGVHDSGEIVIDEVVGFVIAMIWLPSTWQAYVLAFLLFRALDILKPFPIGLLDKKVQGGMGVVVDDLAAGILTNIVLQVIYTKTTWLGEMYLQ